MELKDTYLRDAKKTGRKNENTCGEGAQISSCENWVNYIFSGAQGLQLRAGGIDVNCGPCFPLSPVAVYGFGYKLLHTSSPPLPT